MSIELFREMCRAVSLSPAQPNTAAGPCTNLSCGMCQVLCCCSLNRGSVLFHKASVYTVYHLHVPHYRPLLPHAQDHLQQARTNPAFIIHLQAAWAIWKTGEMCINTEREVWNVQPNGGKNDCWQMAS